MITFHRLAVGIIQSFAGIAGRTSCSVFLFRENQKPKILRQNRKLVTWTKPSPFFSYLKALPLHATKRPELTVLWMASYIGITANLQSRSTNQKGRVYCSCSRINLWVDAVCHSLDKTPQTSHQAFFLFENRSIAPGLPCILFPHLLCSSACVLLFWKKTKTRTRTVSFDVLW